MAKQNFNKTFRATRAQTRRTTNSSNKARVDESGKKRRDGEYSFNHTKEPSSVTFQ